MKPRSQHFHFHHAGYKLQVHAGNTYLLRIINSALNEELFFKIAGHELTVVEVDAVYTKPLKTNTIVIAPGQTTNVLLKANRATGKYLVAATPFMDSPISVDNVTATATLHYAGSLSSTITTLTSLPPKNATPVATSFTDSLRSLNSKKYPARVPIEVDHSLFFTVSLGVNPCPTCLNGSRVVAAINNVTFVMPKVSLLQAHFFNISGVFTDDFPRKPSVVYDFTGTQQPANLRTNRGTRVYRLAYNSTVQLVLQDTGMITPENHPIHLHGFNFFVVGRGQGNFNAKRDTKKFNLVDPVERNTVGVPSGGWTAIRFRADNPGEVLNFSVFEKTMRLQNVCRKTKEFAFHVSLFCYMFVFVLLGVWFMHCHLEIHTTWGLKMAFVVDNGKGPNESLLPPPSDLPKC